MVPSLADQLYVIGSSSGSAATAVIIVLSPEITSAGLAAILEIAGDWFGTGAGGGTGGGAGAAQALPKMAARANTATTVTRLPLEILILNTPPFYLIIRHIYYYFHLFITVTSLERFSYRVCVIKTSTMKLFRLYGYLTASVMI